jgi:THO complex subunit 3
MRAEGKEVHTFANPNASFSGAFINMTWSPDGRWLAAGDKGDNVILYNAVELTQQKPLSIDAEVNEMVFSNGSQHLFISVAGSIRVLSVPGLETLHEVMAHQAPVISVDADPFGRCARWCLVAIRAHSRRRYLAVGSMDAVVSLWDIEEWACVRAFSRSECVRLCLSRACAEVLCRHPIRKCHFSCDGEMLAITADENIDLVSMTHMRKHNAPILRTVYRRVRSARLHHQDWATGGRCLASVQADTGVHHRGGARHPRLWRVELSARVVASCTIRASATTTMR